MTTDRIDHVVALLHGEEPLEAYAARHQLDAHELREWKALYLAGNGAALARRPRRWRYALLGAVVAAALLPASVRAVGSCSQTLPAPLVTLCPDEPAVAGEVNENFRVLAKTLLDRTGGALDGGANIVQTGTSRLLSTDGIVRVGGDRPTVQLQLDTSNGGSGAGLWVGASDTLYVNRSNAFSGGTVVDGALGVGNSLGVGGALNVGGTLTANNLLTTGGQMHIGDATHPTNLAVWGELQADRIRASSCTWRGGATVGLNADTGAECLTGEYSAGTACQVPAGAYLRCSVKCCRP